MRQRIGSAKQVSKLSLGQNKNGRNITTPTYYLSNLSAAVRGGAGGNKMELYVGPVLGPVHELGVHPRQTLHTVPPQVNIQILNGVFPQRYSSMRFFAMVFFFIMFARGLDSDVKGTVSRELRHRLLYIIQKLFLRPIVASLKILILLKGQFSMYIKQFSVS